jgi:prepilin-type N-terminal cleavage/methylation domain-containing protein
MPPESARQGLTLIELLLTIAILAILASIAIIVLNPPKGAPEVRDARRLQHATSILDAVYRYANDHDGLPPGIPLGEPGEICRFRKTCNGIPGAVHLDVLMEGYLTVIPIDPGVSRGEGTGYFIVQSSGGLVTVSAPSAEGGEIRTTR